MWSVFYSEIKHQPDEGIDGMEGKTTRNGKFQKESGKRHEKRQHAVQDQSMEMEKSWVMMKDWTDKEHE